MRGKGMVGELGGGGMRDLAGRGDCLQL